MSIVKVPEKLCDEALEWAKETCPGYITNDVYINLNGYNTYISYEFYFNNEEDALAFKLKFGL